MLSIETFKFPVVPGEIKVSLPARSSLFDAWETPGESGNISVAYFADQDAADTVEVTLYCFHKGEEIADNFPGKFFKAIQFDSGAVTFLFFRTPYTKREPIIVTPKLTDEQRAAINERVNESGNE